MLTAILCAILIVFVLCTDVAARRRRKALTVALAALQARTAAHAQQIETLGRALAALVPPDARPTSPHPSSAVDRGRARLPAAPLAPRAVGDPALDDAPPSPQRHVAAVERQIAEMAGASAPPVETEGDRPGVNPGDALELGRLPGESREAWGDRLDLLDLERRSAELAEAEEIRERFQRVADDQDARDAVPSAGSAPSARSDDDPEDERTRVRSRSAASRPDALAGVAPERPTSSATRTAEAFERAHPCVEAAR